MLRLLRPLIWVMVFVGVTGVLGSLLRPVEPLQQLCPDYLCFWAAGKIIASGENPYDAGLQAQVQQEYGWNPATDGLGMYEFMPYYYPPSVLAPLCALLVPLGYPAAKVTWLIVNVELLVLSGWLLRRIVPGVPPSIPLVLVPLFALSVLAVLIGQLTPLLLLLTVAVWKLLEERWDRSAGWVLAWTMMKPQLALLLLVGIVLWSIRERRWRVLQGLGAGGIVLILSATMLWPSWPSDLVQAPGRHPLPTDAFPWIGTSWLLLLRSTGLNGWTLWISYGLLALPGVVLVVRTSLQIGSPLRDVVALSLLAAFFVAPYARAYDLPILIVPVLVLLGHKHPEAAKGLLMFVLLIVPWLQLYWVPPNDPLAPAATYFWIPVLLSVLWFVFRSRIGDAKGAACQGA